MKKNVLIVTLAILIIGLGVFLVTRKSVSAQTTNSTPSQSPTSVAIPADVDTADLVAENGQTGSGIATRQFMDSMFIHGLTVTLADPPAGQFYAGWLIENGDANTAVLTGKLINQADGSYSLDYSSPVDYRSYSEVLVTLQTAENQAPQTPVLSGTFQTK